MATHKSRTLEPTHLNNLCGTNNQEIRKWQLRKVKNVTMRFLNVLTDFLKTLVTNTLPTDKTQLY